MLNSILYSSGGTYLWYKSLNTSVFPCVPVGVTHMLLGGTDRSIVLYIYVWTIYICTLKVSICTCSSRPNANTIHKGFQC